METTYIGTKILMERYDKHLLEHGYTMIELVDKASECLLRHSEGDKFSVFCGPGHNGADGLSLALKLHAQGKEVFVYIFEEENISETNRYYLDLCRRHGLALTCLKDNHHYDIFTCIPVDHILIDAIFGFGLNRQPEGLYLHIIQMMNCCDNQDIIAIDIPSGLNCDTGIPYQSAVCATKTITLSAMKNGFLLPESSLFTGEVVLEKLDVIDAFDDVLLYQLCVREDAVLLLKQRQFHGYKGTYGYPLMIVGSSAYTGAALLSVKSAVYTGSGIVTLLSQKEVNAALAVYCPEAVSVERTTSIHDIDLKKYHAILIGSGLGLDSNAKRYVTEVLSTTQQALVIDGDGLTILAHHLEQLQQQNREVILTPHMGEFQRLCSLKEHDDILVKAQSFAQQYGVVLVLKGPYTIVTNGQESYRVSAGNKAMATAGMGDVLAGMITSLLGQGYTALDAALLGVYLHGYAGDLLAKNQYTVLPSQLIEKIPDAMYTLLNK